MPDEEGEPGRRHALRRLRGRLEAEAGDAAAVRAFSEQRRQRKTVSHMAKAVRGDVARALLLAKKAPADPEAAAAIVPPPASRSSSPPANLDVIVYPARA